MESYRRAAVERAMAKKITWKQAGEIIGLCERQMRRWKERYLKVGYDGLFDRRTGKPSPKHVPVAIDILLWEISQVKRNGASPIHSVSPGERREMNESEVKCV